MATHSILDTPDTESPALRQVRHLDDMYLSAEEAAAELGITVPTFYSYVSRKPVRSEAIEGSRRRVYWRPDVEALRRGGTEAIARRLALTTAITFVTDQGPFYRGKSAIMLSRTHSLEATAALLWDVPEAVAFGAAPRMLPATLWERTHSAAQLTAAIDACIVLMTLLEVNDQKAFDLSRTGFAQTAANALRWCFATVVDAPVPSDEPLHEFVRTRLGVDEAHGDLLRRMLVLSADHGITPSTAATRCVATSGLTPYRLAVAGLVACGGRRLPFGQVGGLSLMIEELLNATSPATAIMLRLREGHSLIGFGTGFYGEFGDPRAAEFLRVLRERFGDHADVKKLLAGCDTVLELTGRHPDFALLSVFVCKMLGLATQHRVLNQIARITGWAAHGYEEYAEPEPLQVREFYTGPLPQRGE